MVPSIAGRNRDLSFRLRWPCIINVGEERTKRCHRYRCLFTISFISTCFGHHYAHRQENRLYKTACIVSLDVLAAMVWSRDTSWAHTVRSAQQIAFEQDQDGPSWSCSKAVFKPVWHIPWPSVQWENSWWWAEELPETCRVSCQNKFVESVHLVGFIIKKF